jgi:hypothetical protein
MYRRIPVMTAVVTAIALTLVALTGVPAAFASFTSARAAALRIDSVTVHSPSGATASVSCAAPATVTVSWTAPSGATPSGYSVSAFKDGSGPTHEKTVSGTTTSTSFSISGLIFYAVVIQAQYGPWTSAASSQSNSVFCL